MKKNGVVCAVDVNDFDQDVIDLAASMARQFGVSLDLLHVTLFPNTASKSIYVYIGNASVYRKERRLLEGISTNIEGVKVKIHHLSGSPAEQVLRFSESSQPRLLVLGTHGRKGLARIFGSVASKVLRQARCPVMVLRQRQNNQNFEAVDPAPRSAKSSTATRAKSSACDH